MPKAVRARYAQRAAYAPEYQFTISKGPKNKVFLVSEGVQEVEEGAILTWFAHGTDATVSFNKIGGQQVVEPEAVEILDGGEGSVQVLPDVIARIGRYSETMYRQKKVHVPYKVYCDKTNNYAEGGSDPKIIVKGP